MKRYVYIIVITHLYVIKLPSQIKKNIAEKYRLHVCCEKIGVAEVAECRSAAAGQGNSADSGHCTCSNCSVLVPIRHRLLTSWDTLHYLGHLGLSVDCVDV